MKCSHPVTGAQQLTGLSRAQGRKSCPQGNLRELSTADLPFKVQDGSKYLQELGLGRQVEKITWLNREDLDKSLLKSDWPSADI